MRHDGINPDANGSKNFRYVTSLNLATDVIMSYAKSTLPHSHVTLF